MATRDFVVSRHKQAVSYLLVFYKETNPISARSNARSDLICYAELFIFACSSAFSLSAANEAKKI